MTPGDTAEATSPEAPTGNAVEDVAAMFAQLRAPEPPETAEAQLDTKAAVTEAEEAPDESTEAASEEDAPPTKLKFKLDDEEFDEDTLREWKQSGLRQADYTKKTMALSEKEKAFQAEMASKTEQVAAYLKQLEEGIKSLTPQEPNWSELKTKVSDAEFIAAFAEWSTHKQRMAALAAEREQAEKAVAAERQVKLEADAKRNVERVMELLPEWKDEGVRKQDWGDIQEHVLVPLGVSAEEVLQLNRPEVFRLLKDAAELRHLKAKAVAPQKQAGTPPPPLKPGSAPSTKSKVSATELAAKRLKESGSVEAMASVFKSYRTGG